METKEPDSRLSVRKEDLDDQELYRLNQVINDLYSKITTTRDETADAANKFVRAGAKVPVRDLTTAPAVPPPEPASPGIPQPQSTDWTLDTPIYSAGEDGLQYGFAKATISNKPAVVDYYSMFIQDYSSGYVDTSGTAVTLTSASKEAGNTFENCIAGQVININSVAYTIASTPVAPYESLTLTTSAGTQSNVYFNLDPVDGKWEEIASDAEAGTWQLRPPTGWDVPCCLTASTKGQKTFEPPAGVNYKRLQFAAWGVSPQVSNLSVAVETKDQGGVPSGRFSVNFTKPLDPEYSYTSIERLPYTTSAFTGNIGATARVDVNSTTKVITYNGSTFTGQNFAFIQPGDTVYLNTGSTISDSDVYIVDELISSTQLRLATVPAGSPSNILFSQWGRIAGEVDSFKQTDYWPLPSSQEFWKFRARAVNHREIANNTSPPTVNVTVPNSSGITAVAPGTITAASFASSIRPVDLVTTASITVSSIVVTLNSGVVTTTSAHGLSNGRQVAIFGGTGTSSKLNGLYTISSASGSTFTITTSGVSNGTYSAGLNEVPLPSLPSSTYPNGAVAFITANTKLYRSNGTAWTIAADGSDIVANSITAGQIAAGAISTTELFAGEILVGQGSGKPTLFKVVDSSSNMIGFIGDITTPTYPVNFVGAYFVNLRIGPNISTPIVSASSSGVSINGATFTLAANGITTTIDNTTIGTYTAGLRIQNTASTKTIQLGLDGGSVPSLRINDTTSGSPSVTVSVASGNYGYITLTDQTGTSGIELVGQYSTYTTGTWRGSITTGRIEATREFKLGNSTTAGYVLTADAQGIGTWQAAGGSSGAAGSTGQVQYNNSGVLAATANFSWNNTNQLLQVASSSTDPNRGIISSQHNDDVQTAGLYLRKSRGSLSSPTVVASGDFIGALTGQAYDGSNYISASRIAFQVESTPSTGSVPVRMVFQTGTSGGGTERMRIDSSGNVGIGTLSPDALLTVNTIASFGDGAETTPSIAHKGDLNTGFWFPAVDTVAVSTDGAERWRVTSAGFLIPADSDTYDIGVLSTNRVRGVYTKIVDTAASGGTGDYIQTRKLQLFDNTGSTTAPSFWDMNVVMSGVGALQNSYFYMRDNGGNKVFQSERISSGSAVDRTFWYTDLLPDTNFGQSLGSISYKWQTIYANQLGDSLNPVTVYGGNSVFSQVTTGTFQFTASPSSGYFLKSDATGYASWATVTSQLSAGAGISITGTATATITNSGVTSITGTSNQVIASASTGGVTLSLPQSIATTSNVTFNSLTLANGASNGILIKDTGGTARTCLTIASDNNLYLDNNDSTYDIYIRPGSGRYTFVDGSYFAPFTNNAISLGYNGQGWSNVYSYAYYAHNGTSWSAGWTGTFSTGGQTVTVQDGIITNVA